MNDCSSFVTGICGHARENVTGKHRQNAVGVNEVPILINHTHTVSITIDADAEFSTGFNNLGSQFDHVLGSRWIRWVMREGIVPLTMHGDGLASQLIAKVDHERTRDSIGTIDGYFHTTSGLPRFFENIGHIICEEITSIDVLPFASTEISGFKHISKCLYFIASHRSSPTTHLESVILWRIVAGGNHHTAINFEIRSRTVECSSCANAEIMNITTCRHQTIDESLVKFRSRFTNVSTHSQCSTIKESREGTTQSIGK